MLGRISTISNDYCYWNVTSTNLAYDQQAPHSGKAAATGVQSVLFLAEVQHLKLLLHQDYATLTDSCIRSCMHDNEIIARCMRPTAISVDICLSHRCRYIQLPMNAVMTEAWQHKWQPLPGAMTLPGAEGSHTMHRRLLCKL